MAMERLGSINKAEVKITTEGMEGDTEPSFLVAEAILKFSLL